LIIRPSQLPWGIRQGKQNKQNNAQHRKQRERNKTQKTKENKIIILIIEDYVNAQQRFACDYLDGLVQEGADFLDVAAVRARRKVELARNVPRYINGNNMSTLHQDLKLNLKEKKKKKIKIKIGRYLFFNSVLEALHELLPSLSERLFQEGNAVGEEHVKGVNRHGDLDLRRGNVLARPLLQGLEGEDVPVRRICAATIR
jgi:hypothetical protein